MIEEFNVNDIAHIVIEQIPYLESVSYSIMLPGGLVGDDEKTIGASLFLPEITSRGTKKYSAKELNDKLDGLGVNHGESASLDSFIYKGTCLSENINETLSLVLDMIYEPSFPEDEVDNIRDLCLQDLLSNEDNPAKLVIKKLINKYHKSPFNRDADGEKEGIENTTLKDIKDLYEKYYSSKILIVLAGNISDDAILFLKDYFKNKKVANNLKPFEYSNIHKPQYLHIDYDSEQTQIALAYNGPLMTSPDYYTALLASEILSGGMFGRLFIEVREKRGLVYAIYSQFSANKYSGESILYTGTTPKNAKETLQVSLDTISSLGENLSEEELIRAKNNLKSGILIRGETSLARSSNIAFDMWQLGYNREKEFIIDSIDKVTSDDIKNYLQKYPYKNYTIVSLGKKEIKGVID